MASPELQMVLQMLVGNPLVGERPPAEMRAGLEAMAGTFARARRAGRACHRRRHGGGMDHVGRRLARASSCSICTAALRSAAQHAPRSAAWLGRAAARVLGSTNVRARASPPAAVDDAVAAYRWLLARGVAVDHLAVAGDSAGGGLTIATLIALRDLGVPLPTGGVCFSPWVDMEATGESMRTKVNDPMLNRALTLHFARFYLGTTDPRTPLASPLHAELRGLPPLLIQASRDEVLPDDATRITEKARRAGIDCELDLTDEVPVWQISPASYLKVSRRSTAPAHFATPSGTSAER
jgi:hypothetical protein